MILKSKAIVINLLLITCVLSGCMGGENQEETQGSLVIAFEVQADYENIDEIEYYKFINTDNIICYYKYNKYKC